MTNIKTRRIYQTIIIVLLASLLASCASNKLTVRFLYSRLDNTIANRFEEYADFDKQQKAWIRQSANDFMKWNRQTQLPLYAEFIEQANNRLRKNQPLSNEDMRWILSQLEVFTERSYRASPFPNSIEFLQSLNDRQIVQIEQKIAADNQEFLNRADHQSKQDHENERIEDITSGLAKLRIDLNQNQQQIIINGRAQYVGDPDDRFNVWTDWTNKMVALLKYRNSPSFPQRARQHIAVYQKMMKTYRPEETRINRGVTINIATRVVNDFDKKQLDNLSRVLADTSSLFRSMAIN